MYLVTRHFEGLSTGRSSVMGPDFRILLNTRPIGTAMATTSTMPQTIYAMIAFAMCLREVRLMRALQDPMGPMSPMGPMGAMVAMAIIATIGTAIATTSATAQTMYTLEFNNDRKLHPDPSSRHTHIGIHKDRVP